MATPQNSSASYLTKKLRRIFARDTRDAYSRLIQRVHESTRLGMMSRSDEPALDAVGGQKPSAPCVSQQLGHIPSSLRLFEHRRLRHKAHLQSLPSRARFCYCYLSVGLAQWRAHPLRHDGTRCDWALCFLVASIISFGNS